MLGFLRKNSDSWVIKVILGVLSLTFILFFGTSTLFGERTEVVASVNGEPIRDMELTNLVRQQVRFQQRFNPNMKDDEIERIRLQVLDDLIERRLLLQTADDLGITVSDKAVRRAILENPNFHDDAGKFDKALYEKYVGRRGGARYERDVREALTIEALESGVRAAVLVSEGEVRAAFQDEASRREIEFVKVSTASFEDQVTLTDEEVATWAGEHADAIAERYERDKDTVYNQPKKVRARHVLMKYGEGAGEDERAEVKRRMEAVLAEANAGTDFSELAKKYSEDTSASRGGDLGLFDEKRMVGPFSAAAFALPVGGTSELVETEFGLHIIRVDEIVDAKAQGLDDVRLTIAGQLMKAEKAPELAKAYAASLVPGLKGELAPEAWDALLAQHAVTVQETGEFARKDRRIPKLGVSDDAMNAAFALVGIGDVTPEPVELPTGWAVLKLKAAATSTDEDFASKKDELRDRLLRTKQARATNAWRESLKAEARISVAAGV